MEPVELYFAALFIVVFFLCAYAIVQQAPAVATLPHVWLPALLSSALGGAAVWGGLWLLLGPERARVVFLYSLTIATRGRHSGPVTAVDAVYLFALCASVLCLVCLRVRSRMVQRRGDQAIAQEIERWRRETKPKD